MTDFLEILRCPLCAGPLFRADGCLRCADGHSYDPARAGYVNLLPPGRKNNAKTGDEREMIRARSEFLRCGFYDPIDEALSADLSSVLPQADADAPLRVCDMGAGEGYHTCKSTALLAEKTGRHVDVYGFDASKSGAEAGCRLAKALGFLPKEGIAAPMEAWNPDSPVRAAVLPGNLFHLPVADASMHAALSLFAPVAWEEAARVLSPGGVLAVVSAGRGHLLAMRAVLYDEVRLTDFHPAPPEDFSGFTLLGRRTVDFPVTLSSQDEIAALFMMTPFWHRTGDAGRARLASLDRLAVTASAEISLWEAHPCSSPS